MLAAGSAPVASPGGSRHPYLCWSPLIMIVFGSHCRSPCAATICLPMQALGGAGRRGGDRSLHVPPLPAGSSAASALAQTLAAGPTQVQRVAQHGQPRNLVPPSSTAMTNSMPVLPAPAASAGSIPITSRPSNPRGRYSRKRPEAIDYTSPFATPASGCSCSRSCRTSLL